VRGEAKREKTKHEKKRAKGCWPPKTHPARFKERFVSSIEQIDIRIAEFGVAQLILLTVCAAKCLVTVLARG
jgi:hypothetical protein